MGEAAKRITKRTEQNEATKAKRAPYDATSVPAKAEDIKQYMALTTKLLTDYYNRKLYKEYIRGWVNSFKIGRVNPSP